MMKTKLSILIGILLLLGACASIQIQSTDEETQNRVHWLGYTAMEVYLIHNPDRIETASTFVDSIRKNTVLTDADIKFVIKEIRKYFYSKLLEQDNIAWYITITSTIKLFEDKLGIDYDLPQNFDKSKLLIETFLLGMESAVEDAQDFRFQEDVQ